MSRSFFGGSGLDDDGGPLSGGSLPGTPSLFKAARQRPRFAAAPPAAAEAAKASLVDRGASGLSYVASALDKPGRAVRGLLAGQPRELLAAIPFSDSLGLTDHKQAVSPDDLLVHHGLLQAEDPANPAGFFSGRTLAGLGAGILTDPLTYASFGASALTRAGAAAKAAGLTRGWGHRQLIEGFTHTADDLLRTGSTAEEIAHLGRSGARVAPAGSAFRANEPLAGAVGVGLPFRDPVATLGHGDLSKGIAGGFDRAYDALKFAPGVRTVRQWFDTRAGRSAEPIAQRANEVAAKPLADRLRAEAGVSEYAMRARLGRAIGDGPLGSELEAANILRNRAEGQLAGQVGPDWAADLAARHAAGTAPGVVDPAAVEAHLAGQAGPLGAIGDEMRAGYDAMIAQARHHGADPHVLADAEAEYARRQALAAPRNPGLGGAGRPERIFGTASPADRARRDVLKDIPGGTGAINAYAMDARLSGSARTLNDADVVDHLARDGWARWAAAHPGQPIDPDTLNRINASAGGLGSFLKGLDPLHAANKLPLFHPDAIGDYVARAKANAKVVGNAAGAVEGLAAGARPLAQFGANPAIPLTEAIERLGLKTHRPFLPADAADLAHLGTHGIASADEFRQLAGAAASDPAAAARIANVDPLVAARLGETGFDGAAARVYEAMARHGAPQLDMMARGSNPLAYLARHGIAEGDLDALGRYMQGFQTPHEAQGFLKGMDGFQALFKAMTYPLWPASHVRNAASIAYNNAINNGSARGLADAVALVRGRSIDGSRYGAHLAGMTPEAQADWLKAQAYGHAGVGSGGSFNEVSRDRKLADFDTLSGEAGKLLPPVPLSGRSTPGGTIAGDFGGIFRELAEGLKTKAGRNPLGVRGVGGRADDTFAPLVAGRKVGENIEDTGRLANFLDNLAAGQTPEVAGRATNRIHFDYGDLTPMERNYFRKLVPFYTFMRKNLPEQARLLAQRPNAIAPTIRAATGGQTTPDGRDGYVPDYLASGPAIRLGGATGPDGKTYQRYISGTGLPLEEALERLKFRQWDIGGHKVTLPDLLGTGQAFAGMANGYLKAPIEMMTDTQLHTGRRLSDLYKPTPWNGYGTIAGPVGDFLSEAGQNLPGTRFATTFNKLADDRKPAWAKLLNLATGVKVTDVDAEKAYNIEARKAWEEMARQDPRIARFENFYVKPDATVDPELKARMEVWARMGREAHEAADRKRQELMLQSFRSGPLAGVK